MLTLESLQKEIEELKKQNRLLTKAVGDLAVRRNEDSAFDEIIKEEISKTAEAQPKVKLSKFDKKQSGAKLEEKIGKKWFAFIGILAMVVGIGFFVKYLSDNGFIGPVVRITLGFLAGVFLIIFGEIASRKEKYYKWGKVLVGGGLAAVYFVIYAAYNFVVYRDALGMTQGLDIFLLGLTALAAIIFSLKDNLQIVAAEAFILGLITCLLSADFSTLMLVYNLILALVVVVVSVYKKWSLLGLSAVIGTYLIYFSWRSSNEDFMIGIVFLGVYFLTYLIQSVFPRSGLNNKNNDNIIVASGLINSCLFFAAGMELVRSFHPVYDASFCLILSVLHFGAFALAHFLKQKNLSYLYFYLSAAFLVIAAPLHFEKSSITISWAVLGVVFLLSFLKTKFRPLEYCYYALSFATAGRFLLFDCRFGTFSWENFNGDPKFYSAIAVAGCFFLAYFLLFSAREKISPAFKKFALYFYSFFPTFVLMILPLLGESKNSQYLTLFWSIIFAALIILTAVKKFKEFEWVGSILGLTIISKIFFYDLVYQDWFNHIQENIMLPVYIFTAAVFYISAAINYAKKEFLSKEIKDLPAFYAWVGTVTVFSLFWIILSGYWISVAWAILALILVLTGFVINKKEFRYQGIVVLTATIFKVFLYDTRELETIYRTISFMVLGAILLVSSFLYSKYKEKLKEII